MKAYIVDTNYSDYSTVVFAEDRGKAKAIAMYTDALEGADYIDIRARRCPALDKYYFGRTEMDWCEPTDRIALVKEVGWFCSDETFDSEECPTCPARKWCDRREDKEWNEHCEAEAMFDSMWGDQS